MLKRIFALTAAAALALLATAPISADQDASLIHLRSIADRPDVLAALDRFDALAAEPTGSYSLGWEQDLLSLQLRRQSELFGK
jgi:hypothetical protein